MADIVICYQKGKNKSKTRSMIVSILDDSTVFDIYNPGLGA